MAASSAQPSSASVWLGHEAATAQNHSPSILPSITSGTKHADVATQDTAAIQGHGQHAGHRERRPSQMQIHTHGHPSSIQQLDPYKTHKLLLSGALAGAVSRTMTAPVDRLKMILQVQDDCKRGMTLKEGIQRMASEGSWTTYFKGNGANVIKIAPETAMKLTLNDSFKVLVARDPERMTPMERMCAGGVAGAVAQFLTYPLDTIRTRLAVSTHGTYQGIFHAVALMRQQEGMRGFYRGLVPSMIGILPYAGVDICLFEIFKQHLHDEAERSGRPAPHLSLLGAGMLSSSIAQVASYPLALIRTRLQAQGGGGGPVKYKGMTDVLFKTIEREGLRGLYKGLLPNIFKLAPAAGISWYVFEETKQALGLDPRV